MNGYHEERYESTEEKSGNESDDTEKHMSLSTYDSMDISELSDENPEVEVMQTEISLTSGLGIEIQKQYARAVEEYKWMQKSVVCGEEPEKEFSNTLCPSQSQLSIIDKVLQLVWFSMKPETKEGKFASGIVHNINPRILFEYLQGYEVAKMQSPEIDMLGAKFYQKLSLNPDNDIRLNRSFLLAHPGFDRRKPVASILTSITNGHRVVDSKNDAIVLGETILGQVWTALQSPIQVAVRWCHAFPVAMTTGESWTHIELKLSSGRRRIVVARAKYYHADPTLALVQFQDVSENFDFLFKLPELR